MPKLILSSKEVTTSFAETTAPKPKYKEASNKDAKLAELKESGIEGYCYKKDGQYYVLSMISEDQKKVEKHAVDMKGIMKTYVVSSDTTVKTLLDNLSKGVIHD